VILSHAPEVRGTFSSVTPGVLAAAVLTAGTLLVASAAAQAAELRRWAGAPLPDFVLQDLDGGDVRLDAPRSPVTLVHFFATWCEPCREELPALHRLIERTPQNSLRVLAISVAEADIGVRRFFQMMPVNFSVLLDRERVTARQWKVDTLPSTFVLDARLQPRLFAEGDFAWDRVKPERLLEAVSAGDAGQPLTIE
jgi:thiol-disulfide isomerase/thioredoxin